MMKVIFIFSILLHLSSRVELLEIPIITNIQDMIGLAHDVGDIVSGNIPFKNLFAPVANPLDGVLKQIDGVTQQIQNLDTKLDDVLAAIIARLPLEDNINTDIRDLQQLITRVDETYNDFLAYSQNISDFSNSTLLEFTTKVTSTKTGNIPNILNTIFTIIVPKQTALARVGFLENMIQKRKVMTTLEMCGSPISFQNRLFQIYNLISITEMRAFVMTGFAHRLKNEFENVKLVGEIRHAQSAFILRMDQYLIKFRQNMVKASRDIFLCDSESLVDKDTYVELEGLFTAYVMNEMQAYSGSCSANCPSIRAWSHDNCYSISDQHYCPINPCRGLVYNCGWIGGDVDICEYTDGTAKRYQWVRSYSNGWYGKSERCEGRYRAITSRYSGFYRCDLCMCRCEDAYGKSIAIRTFSLRPQISNIDENKVVSDVKFTMKDKMIHIQIEEAPMLPLGQLDKNQSSWIALEDFVYLSNSSFGSWKQIKDGKYIPLFEGTDYAFIRKDQRILNLDSITGRPNYVLTGVRLNHESDDESRKQLSPVQLEIHVTPFDYASGKLTSTEENPSLWLAPLTQPKVPSTYAEKRTELTIGDISYKYESVQNPPHIESNQFIKFRQTANHDDVGQSTVPYMDSRPTAPSNSLVFDGLSLIYRGHPRYGGFLAFKPTTIDISHYMDSSMTSEQRKYYRNGFRSSVSYTPSVRQKKS